MTALPAVKREALRFRIWQFAAPREWNVTIAEIAEALGVHWTTIRSVINRAGWNTRVRVNSGPLERRHANASGALGGSLIEDYRPVVRDVLAGRVNSEFTA